MVRAFKSLHYFKQSSLNWFKNYAWSSVVKFLGICHNKQGLEQTNSLSIYMPSFVSVFDLISCGLLKSFPTDKSQLFFDVHNIRYVSILFLIKATIAINEPYIWVISPKQEEIELTWNILQIQHQKFNNFHHWSDSSEKLPIESLFHFD